MKGRLLSLTTAACMAGCLVLTACSAARGAEDTETENILAVAERRTTSFVDIPENADYGEAVNWCRDSGLMEGTGQNRFDPEGTLTRAMLVTALYRAAGKPSVTATPSFHDIQAGAWYWEAVAWASANALVQGYGDGYFGTNDPVSVEQLDVILGRYAEKETVWTGDPARAHTATRAQVALALYEELGQGDGTPAEVAGRTLVVYFSATNTTRTLAGYAADLLNADLFEIRPETPYTEADLAYYTDCRADREQSDPAARPVIDDDCTVEDMGRYDVVLLGYPIWHGQAPKIIYSFLEGYDFTGKTIVPFCTSASSGMSSSAVNLHSLTGDAVWLEGRRFGSGTSSDEIRAWLDGLDLPKQKGSSGGITLSFNGHTYSATLADNASAAAFAALLEKGPLTISAHDYGNFEKVGSLGTTLPCSDEQITTAPGDIILYQGNQITVYYAPNTWSFTRLGRIDDPSGLELALGDGDVELTFQMAPLETLP